MTLDTIYNQDCLIGMKDLPNASIDCIITDLPYGVLNRSNASAQWDCIIPFEPMWEQFLRVAKHDAPIILFAQGMFTAQLMLSQPKIWRYNLVWDKGRPTGFLNANRMPMRIHEDICIFYRDMPVYNPQMTQAAPHARNHGRGSGNHVNKNQCYGQWCELRSTISDEKYPVSIIKIPKEHKADTFHPTQKPVALLRYLIRTYTKSGGGNFGLLYGLRNYRNSGPYGASSLHRLRNRPRLLLPRPQTDRGAEERSVLRLL